MAGSFWSNFGLRFNSSSSGLDELLEKGEGGENGFTLQQVIAHDQVIQECKYMNQQLCEYLSKPHVIRQLVQYVIAPPPASATSEDPLDVGGSIGPDGGITTAASMKRRREKAAVAAAQAAAAASADAGSSAAAAATPAATPTAPAADDESSFGNSSSDEDDDTLKTAPATDDADTLAEAEQKYPYQASELFSCEVASMLDALFEPEASSPDSPTTASISAPLGQVIEGEEKPEGESTPLGSSPVTSPASPAKSASPGLLSSSSAATAASPAALSSTPRLPMLDLLLSFLDQPAPIDPAHASYFRKVMVVLIQRKYEPLVRYLAAHGSVDKLLRHIGLYSIMEVLIMLGWDDGLGGNQDVGWLVANDLTGKLLEQLNPIWETEHNQPDVIINASRALVDVVVKCPASTYNPLITRLLDTSCQQLLYKHMFSGSFLSLSNALSIVIVLVQRYANRMDLGEEIMDEVKAAALAAQAAALDAPEDDQLHSAAAAALAASSPSGSAKLPEPFLSLVPHLARILGLLRTEIPPEQDWSYGRARAFGETRLKVVEMILVLVRCKVVEVEQVFRDEDLLSQLLDAFVQYPWNNMLHGLVESIIRTVLEFLVVTCLKPALFLDAKLADRLVDAYEQNAKVCEKGRGFRLGYMGHLVRTAEVVEQYLVSLEAAATDSGESTENIRVTVLGSSATVERWGTFVRGPLAQELEACKVIMPLIEADADVLDDQSDADALASMGASFNASKQDTVDYAFDPDDTGNLAYDYSPQIENNEWADFNTHFSEASIGESPGASSPRDAGKPVRQLIDYALNPDEDGDDLQEVVEGEGASDDWADFDNSAPPAAANANAPPGSPTAAQQAAATAAAAAAQAPAPTAADFGGDDFADFAADFPAAPAPQQ